MLPCITLYTFFNPPSPYWNKNLVKFKFKALIYRHKDKMLAKQYLLVSTNINDRTRLSVNMLFIYTQNI